MGLNCNSKYKLENEEKLAKKSVISLDNDVELLLEECRIDSSHARRYANPILDINLTNLEARKYLQHEVVINIHDIFLEMMLFRLIGEHLGFSLVLRI